MSVKTLTFTLAKTEYSVGVITTREQAEKALELLSYREYPLFGLDIETAPLPAYKGHAKGGLSPYLSQICSIQIFIPEESTVFLFQVSQIDGWQGLFHNFLSHRAFCAHNAQFEIQHFLHNGITLHNIGCSLLLFSLLIHAVSDKPKSIKLGLDVLISIAYGELLDKSEQTGKWDAPELTESQIIYAAKDAVATVIGAQWCLEQMEQRQLGDLIKFYKLNKDAQLPIARMAYNGIAIDLEKHNKLIAEWEIEEAAAREELDKTIPATVNLRSSKQLSDWIISELSKTPEGMEDLAEWERSPATGNLVCDSDELKKFGDLPIVAPLLRFKKVSKLLSTYGKSLQNCINPVTGRIHASFSQCYTGTGRMSSFDPNLQNQPRDSGLRGIFIPKPGYSFISADFSQIEVRVFAYTSGDSELISLYERGGDSYYLAASKILHKPMKEISKAERQKAKAVLLGRLFGLGAMTLTKYARGSYGVEMPLSEAKDCIAQLDAGFSEGREWQRRTTKAAERSLMTSSRMGKLRKLPEDSYYCKALNSPIQSDAAACVEKSATIFDRFVFENEVIDAKLVNIIHDELLVEVKDSQVTLVAEFVRKAMEQGMKFIFPEASINNLVSLNVGKSWAEAKD